MKESECDMQMIYMYKKHESNTAIKHQTNSEHFFPLVLLQITVGPLFGAVLGLVFLLDPRTDDC